MVKGKLVVTIISLFLSVVVTEGAIPSLYSPPGAVQFPSGRGRGSDAG